MKKIQLFRFLTVDPVNLTLKVKLFSVIACFCSIFFVALITQIFAFGPEYPMIIASMGASAVILFFIPNSPLAQPWPFVGGQLFSALVGISCALYIPETSSAAATAVGGSVLIMLLTRCLHPPGAATSLAPIMAGDSITSLGYTFVLVPVGINVVSMLMLSLLINRLLMKRDYPSRLPETKAKTINQQQTTIEPSHHVGISEQDLELALEELDVFIDMTPSDLSHILTQAETNTFKRIRGNLTCADIMIKAVETVEYGTEVEDAWKIMYQQNLKAMPVVDRSRHVIGIITWHDFFKFINLSAYENIQEKFRQFIRRTPELTASKPEAVGMIMTPSVVVLPETSHIVELIPLMSIHGHRQIPVVNHDNRLVGMVYQANLIAAIYNAQLAKQQN